MSDRPPAFVSIRTLARELEMSESTIRDHIRKGDLPKPVRIGVTPRWDWAEVQRFIRDRDSAQDGGAGAPARDPILEAANA